jgi:hypothetical protein
LAVRAITASMSASYHILSTPAAPAPAAMARIAMEPSSGSKFPGATISPTIAVNTASSITRGFMSETKSTRRSVKRDREGKSCDASIAANFMTYPLSLSSRINVVRSRSSCDPQNGGSRPVSKGMRGNRGPMHQQAAIEVRTQAGMRGGEHDSGAATCWARSIHLQFFMAGFAESTQRIGESVTDRLSDPGERCILVGISFDDHS